MPRNILYKFFTFVFIATALSGVSVFVRAQTAEELMQKISAKTDEIKKLEAEINQYKNDLTVLGAKKKTLANSIIELNTLRKKLETDIRVTQSKVETSDLKIRQLGTQISRKENEIESRSAAIKEALRDIYEQDGYTLAQIALSQESFSSAWGDTFALEEFSTAIKENMDALQTAKTDLEGRKTDQEKEKKKQLDLKSELGDRKKIAENARKEQSKLLAQTSNQESSYKKILAQKVALMQAFEQELRDYESTLKFILDPTSIPPRGTKVFTSPLDVMTITQQFGRTKDSVRLYASGTHNGTDFAAHVGTPVKAMLSGEVVGVGDTDMTCPGASYGKWVLVRHGNGLSSLYAHFSLTKVAQGQSVNTGDVIGYSGNTGYSTGPHLHLTVFATNGVQVETRPSRVCGGRAYTMPLAAANAYLNPMDYL